MKTQQVLYRLGMYAILIAAAAVVMYMTLPAINLHDGFFRVIILIFCAGAIAGEFALETMFDAEPTGKWGSKIKYGVMVLPILLVIGIMIGSPFNGPIFKAQDYAKLIEVEEKPFGDDFYEVDKSQIPMIDRDTAERLGNRQLGSMNDLVSQFVPSGSYTQINIGEQPYRVTPLEYAGFFKWINNREEGIPNYLQVDMITGAVDVHKVEGGIKYSDSEYFGRNVKRHLRKAYPTTLFKNPSFEVDDKGHPYYVATTYTDKFFFRQQEPNGVITLDAVTGETVRYKLNESPEWIDRVYSADLIIKQLDMNGKYKTGFWNSRFGKKGVTQTTDGYNYISIGQDIYLYTGVTSANSDASNLGFYLVNMRTKDAAFYPVTSADEYSAKESAEGAVQQMRYESTFPILLNINKRPYYISSLKDDSGLVRQYALVDAQDYQKVYIDTTVDGLFAQLTSGNTKPIVSGDDAEAPAETPTETEEITSKEDWTKLVGTVENVSQAVISGDTVYYLMIDGAVYKANVTLHDQLPFVTEGTNVEGEIDPSNEFQTIVLPDIPAPTNQSNE